MDDYWSVHDPVITEGVDAVAAAARATGHSVVEVDTPEITELAATYSIIVGAEAYATHARWLDERPDDYQPITARPAAHAGRPARTCIRRGAAHPAPAGGRVARAFGIRTGWTFCSPRRRRCGRRRSAPRKQDGVAVRPALLSLNLPFNLTGWPAVSLPGPVADGGLPVGVQLVGVHRDERTLLALAAGLAAAPPDA